MFSIFFAEYGGKWKMLHYYAKDFFAPTSLYIAIESGNLTVYLIRDTDRSYESGTLTITCQPWSSLYAETAHHLHDVKLVCYLLLFYLQFIFGGLILHFTLLGVYYGGCWFTVRKFRVHIFCT